jgi:hypothetical protein
MKLGEECAKCPECAHPTIARDNAECWRENQDEPCRRDLPMLRPLNPMGVVRPSDR